jgi:plasmid stabilization system protein ParE
MKLTIHRLAAKDLEEALDFYRREAGSGLARRFLMEFERQLSLLRTMPGLGTPTEDGRRQQPLRGFPYSLIYRLDGAVGLRVLVLRHQHRKPGYGAART